MVAWGAGEARQARGAGTVCYMASSVLQQWVYMGFSFQLAFLRLIKLKRIRHFKALTKLYGPQAIKSILSGVQIYLLNFR